MKKGKSMAAALRTFRRSDYLAFSPSCLLTFWSSIHDRDAQMRKRTNILVGCVATMITMCAAWGAEAPMPSTAGQIVQAVRQSEQWVGQVDSLVLRFDVTWTKTREGLACRKDMLARRFPGQVLDPNQYVDLQPVARGRLEYAFDRQRMRFVNELAGYWLSQYKEVVKGCWFPMVQGAEVYEKPDLGKPYADCRCEMKVTDLRVNEPLADSLFKVDPASNGRLVDRRQVACKADDRDTGLVGRRLPPLTDLGLEADPCGGPDKGILICLFDWQQRPSRRLLTQLAEKAGSLKDKGLAVLAVQASQTDRRSLDVWLKKQGMDIAVGTLPRDTESVAAGLGTKSLPWLILTDKNLVVTAEGLAAAELGKPL